MLLFGAYYLSYSTSRYFAAELQVLFHNPGKYVQHKKLFHLFF